MVRNLILNKKMFFLLALIILSIFIYFYFSIFMPIIFAFITALILEPLVQGLQKHLKIKKRWLAVTIIFSLFVLLSGLTIYFTLTKLIKEIIKFIYQLPVYMSNINIVVNQLVDDFNQAIADIPQKEIIVKELERQIESVSNKISNLATEIIPLIATWVQGIPHFLFITIIFLIALFLISLELPNLFNRLYRFFKEETAHKLAYVVQKLGKVFIGFFKAQFLVSIIIFVVSYIGLLFIAPKKALIMSFFIWIVDLIPFIGSIIVLLPWSLYHFLAENSAVGMKLSVLAIILLILRRSLEPKIMGDQIGLPALPTLLSLYFGLYFLGIAGLVIGPLVVIAVKSAMEAGIIGKIDYKI